MPSSSFSTTSDGTPRMVEVTGATVIVGAGPLCPSQNPHPFGFEAVTKLRTVRFKPQDIALGFSVEHNL
jgi:hypothetical protein